jgi:hypothetical protein
MSGSNFVQWLAPLAAAVFIVGWVLGIVAFIAVGSESCTTTDLGIAQAETCTDTTAVSIILLMVVGFGATLGALFLLGLRYMLSSLDAIEDNTRRR